ncbi:MAG: metal ABC transporter permease [Anaerolineae bacterium]|jgi:manganese/zinc/iron transport system permease protein|nr:metal ABC transporter permease [Anaerolineae bacterium]
MKDSRAALLIGLATVAAFIVLLLTASANGVTFDYTLRTVALGGGLLGLVTGALGSFAVLRRQSLLGDALSHAALPGVVVAFLLQGRSLGALLIGAAIASLMAMAFITALTRTTKIKQDAAQGIALASWFAAGLVLLSYVQGRPDAGQAGLDKFIFGQAAALVQSDVWLIAGVGAVIFALVGLFWKELKLLAFDAEFAGANGFPVRALDALLSTLMVVAIVLGLQLAGVILMVGLLIAPAVAARQWTSQLGAMVLLAGVFGAFAGSTGAVISGLDVNMPTGPLMIVVAGAVVLLSVLFAPGRGVVWSMMKRAQERRTLNQRSTDSSQQAAPVAVTVKRHAKDRR